MAMLHDRDRDASDESDNVTHGWRCVVTARCLLALAASGGGSVVVCRLKANTHTRSNPSYLGKQ